jgi:hypothetical protein
MEDREAGDGYQEQMAKMEPKDIFCLREVLIFFLMHVDESSRAEIAHLMEDSERWE